MALGHECTIFPSAAPGARQTVLVLPGGGYREHADYEAEPVGQWLSGLGIHAVVLRYPVAPHRYPHALDVAQESIEAARAGSLGLEPTPQVGVLGFSAGGHLAAMLSTIDCGDGTVRPQSAAPDFAILCYPVISFTEDVHQGSVDALLGEGADIQARRAMDADRRVTRTTPPTFVWHTAEDTSVPVTHSLRYAEALHRAGVPVELHVYPTGSHGLGLAEGDSPAGEWTHSCARWLRGEANRPSVTV